MKDMKFRVEMFSFLHELRALHGKIVFYFLNHPFAALTEGHEEHEEKKIILVIYYIMALTSSKKRKSGIGK